MAKTSKNSSPEAARLFLAFLAAFLLCGAPSVLAAAVTDTDTARPSTETVEAQDSAPAAEAGTLPEPEPESEPEPVGMQDMPLVRLRALDKITARTVTFEAEVGSTVRFGTLYIKAQACRKASPLERPEAASFLQVWEITPADESKWVYSGWMFASSPGLSPMDHPIYDVWVLDCLETRAPAAEAAKQEEAAAPGEGVVDDSAVPEQPAAVETAPLDSEAQD